MNPIGQDRAITWPFARGRIVAIGAVAAILAVMIVPRLDYVPLWDGRVYANCVLEAAFSRVTLESLRCANHPSQGWAAVLAIPQLFAPGSMAVMNATNLVLGIVAAAAFRIVLARVFPAREHSGALDLVAIAAAVQPVVVSTMLQPNVDFGVYVFFYVTLAALLSSGPSAAGIALTGGVLLCFSKETGVAAYGLAVGATLLAEHLRTGQALRARIGMVARRGAALSLPLVLFVAYVLAYGATHTGPAIWKHGWQESTADGFVFFNFSDPIFLSYATGLGVLSFMWVAWLPVACDAATGVVRTVRRRAARAVPGADGALLGPFIALTLVLTYLLTSFRTWTNVRYFAVLYPLFLALSYASLVRLGVGLRARQAAFAAIIALFLLGDYRSADPLSRAMYGTFDAGARRMYAMTSFTGESGGPGRDQLVYNLEFADYHRVQNALFDRIRPTDSTVIGAPRTVRWNIWSQLDAATLHRTMARRGVFSPVYADEVDIAARRSPAAWFLDFSNHAYDDHALGMLLPAYYVEDSVIVTSGSQWLVARRLVRREVPSVLP